MMSEIDEYGNQIVYFYDWPKTVKSNVTPNGDGSHTIFINGNLSLYEQMMAYEHELEHMSGGHFGVDWTAMEAEEAI